MKRKIFATVAFACLLAYTSQLAYAGPVDSLGTQLLDKLQTDPRASDTLCRKGKTSIFKPRETIVSLRSLEGNVAKIPGGVGEVLSAVGESICPLVDSTYNSSQFHKNAVNVLNNLKISGKTTVGAENPKKALAEILAHRAQQLQSKVCSSSTARSGPLSTACSLSQKLNNAPAA